MTSDRLPATGGERFGVAEEGLAYDLATYEALLAWLDREDYEFVGFDGAIESGQVAIRHDVDLSVERALEMAKLEAEHGVSATYCVLVTAPVYDVLSPETRRRLRVVAEAGHDVGLHFDPHHYWDEEPLRAEVEARVAADRRALARALGVDVSAVSFHVPPEWALDVDFEGFENTYRPAYFSEVSYVSDSSQCWRQTPPFADGLPDAMQLLVHPGLWWPEDEPVDAIVETVRHRRRKAIEEYLAPIGE